MSSYQFPDCNTDDSRDSGYSGENENENSTIASVPLTPDMDGFDFGSDITASSTPAKSQSLQPTEVPGRESSSKLVSPEIVLPESHLKEISSNRSPLKPIQNYLDMESPVSRKSASRNAGPSKSSFDHRRRLRGGSTSVAASSSSSASSTFHRAVSTSELERRQCLSPPVPTRYSLQILPHRKSSDVGFRRIEGSTLVKLLNEPAFHDRYIVIDCRYPFEFNGGHVRDAINLFDPVDMYRTFFPPNADEFKRMTTRIPIFYCEYSKVRGPNMANALRESDRKRHILNYPDLDYEEIYVLDQGYKTFYSRYSSELTEEIPNLSSTSLCTPNGYIRMTDSKYTKELARYPFHQKGNSTTMSLRSRSSRNLPYSITRPLQSVSSSPLSRINMDFIKLRMDPQRLFGNPPCEQHENAS